MGSDHHSQDWNNIVLYRKAALRSRADELYRSPGAVGASRRRRGKRRWGGYAGMVSFANAGALVVYSAWADRGGNGFQY